MVFFRNGETGAACRRSSAHRPVARGAHGAGLRFSSARGCRDDSDLDLLVGLEPGRSLLDIVAIKQDLEDLLGYPVDVVTEGGLSPYLRERILAEALPLTA
ncbi:MAG TPA: nucleotidyltransferase family protein [Polyangiaceae bacterium]|nr:nucleotidyltransferase family protein [Polyangiaceae bacterium]